MSEARTQSGRLVLSREGVGMEARERSKESGAWVIAKNVIAKMNSCLLIRNTMGVESAREAHGVAAARECPKHQMWSNTTQILMSSVVHDVSLHLCC